MSSEVKKPKKRGRKPKNVTVSKKKDSKEVESESPQPISEKENIFVRFQKLQDHLAKKVDILPLTLKPEEEFWEED